MLIAIVAKETVLKNKKLPPWNFLRDSFALVKLFNGRPGNKYYISNVSRCHPNAEKGAPGRCQPD